MKMIVESRIVEHLRELRSQDTKLRRIGLVYLQKGEEDDRCMVRVISETTDVKWLENEIRKQTIYLPVDPIHASR